LEEAGSGKTSEWKLWKSSSGSSRSSRASEPASDTSSVADGFSSAVVAVARSPPKDFKVIEQERAAISIQTTLRGFLVCENFKIAAFFLCMC